MSSQSAQRRGGQDRGKLNPKNIHPRPETASLACSSLHDFVLHLSYCVHGFGVKAVYLPRPTLHYLLFIPTVTMMPIGSRSCTDPMVPKNKL
eukprot:1158044-Pelagomonas_calceolata.AAC.2